MHKPGGGNYPTPINQALRAHARKEGEAVEETLRRVVREEPQKAV